MIPRPREGDNRASGKRKRIARFDTVQRTTGKRMDQIYPLSKKKTKPADPPCVARLEEWGAEQEIQQLDISYRKRDALQQEISRQNRKIQKHTANSQKLPPIQAWGKQQSTPANINTRPAIPDTGSSTWRRRQNAKQYGKHAIRKRRFWNIQTGIIIIIMKNRST